MQGKKVPLRGRWYYGAAALFVAAALLVCGCASSGRAARDGALRQDPAVASGVLGNGISYYVRQNAEPRNRIVLRLVVRAGSNMEEDDQRGVAHLVEHLAFEGSEHFAPNALIDYFQSIGMNYGADVNAYTSFDHTVYMLEVPADDPRMLATAMQVLYDWACAVSFDPDELEQERGVVVEEWRTGRGAGGRLQDAEFPFLFAGSRYAERLPIGDMDVIRTVGRERVVDFYRRWYRPELMSVVLVGDADAGVLERAVREGLSAVPASAERVEPLEFPVPARKKKASLLVRDPELPASSIDIAAVEAAAPAVTVADVRAGIAADMAEAILNERLRAVNDGGAAPWLGAGAYSASYVSGTAVSGISVQPRRGREVEALRAVLDEYERLRKFGVLEGEVDRQRRELLAQADQLLANKDAVPSASLADAIIDALLAGEPALSIEDSCALYADIVPSVTVGEVNAAARAFLPGRGTVLLAEVPDDDGGFPSEEELAAVWRGYRPAGLAPYADAGGGAADVLGGRPAAKAAIVSRQELPELGATDYLLENGVRFITKKTDFVAGEVLFSAYSDGGYAAVAEEDFPSASVAADYAEASGLGGLTLSQVEKALAGVSAGVSAELRGYTERLSGSAAGEDLEAMFQLLRQRFAFPRFTDEGWNRLEPLLEQAARSHGAQPEDALRDAVREARYGDDYRYRPLSPDFVARIDRAAAERVYRERFANAADFAFVFVGDMDEGRLVELCQYYLGALPAGPEREHTSFNEPPFPRGASVSVVRKGREPQSQVFMAFGGELPGTDAAGDWLESGLVASMGDLLQMKLEDALRARMSATYGVSARAEVAGHAVDEPRQFAVRVAFGCEPGRGEELVAEALSVIRGLQAAPVDEESLVKLREAYRRSKEVALRSNSWWLSRLQSVLVFREAPAWSVADVDAIPSRLTGEGLRDVLRRYVDTENYFAVILEPEI